MPTDLADPPDAITAAKPQRLEYNNPPGVTRRQMSLLLLFLAINTLLFAAFVCLPTASPYIKSLYEDWQRSRAEKKQKELLKSLVNNCLTHTLPPDQLVYAEPPDDATRLLTTHGRARVVEGIARNSANNSPGSLTHAFALTGWRPPAFTGRGEPLTSLLNRLPNAPNFPAEFETDNTCFLHAVKNPSGKERLVWVSVSAKQAPVNDTRANEYAIQTRRRISAQVMDPNDLDRRTGTSISFQESPGDRSTITLSRAPDNTYLPGRFTPRGLWRIRAAQPDPADPTHFTIPYDIDGQPGTIDANLNDGDRLRFTPRTGRLLAWTSGNEYTWELNPNPTTRPAP
jgi:hypothetical protein